jgi:hypothetical protein
MSQLSMPESSQAAVGRLLRTTTWKDLPPVVMAYIEWLALPPEAREPATVAEFALEWKVPTRMLYALESHRAFMEALAPYRLGVGGISRLAVRLATEELVYQATKPGADLNAIKLLLQQAGALTPVVSVSATVGKGDLASMTMEELQAELAASGGELDQPVDID